MSLTPFPRTPRVPMVVGTPENHAAGMGGTDPAIFEIQRARIDVRVGEGGAA